MAVAVQAATVALSVASKAAICHQIRLNWLRKTCRGMSVPFFVLALFSYGAWTVDGMTGGGWSLVLGQGPGVLLCLVIAVQAWWYDRNKDEAAPWLLAWTGQLRHQGKKKGPPGRSPGVLYLPSRGTAAFPGRTEVPCPRPGDCP